MKDAAVVIDGAIKGVIFLAYVQQFLFPALRPGDVVVMGFEDSAPPTSGLSD